MLFHKRLVLNERVQRVLTTSHVNKYVNWLHFGNLLSLGQLFLYYSPVFGASCFAERACFGFNASHRWHSRRAAV